MIPALADDIAVFARTLEAAADRHGWDTPPTLTSVVRDPAGKLWLGAGFAIQEPFGEFVYALGKAMSVNVAGVAEQVAAGLEDNQFQGVLSVAEGWVTLPGNTVRSELRMLTIIDIAGRQHDVLRVRGHDPFTPPDVMLGRVPAGMRLMTLGVVRRLPDNTEALAALKALRQHHKAEATRRKQQANSE